MVYEVQQLRDGKWRTIEGGRHWTEDGAEYNKMLLEQRYNWKDLRIKKVDEASKNS